MAHRIGPHNAVYGNVRGSAAPPAIGHDKLVDRMHAALDTYITARSLGRLWVGMEVVLDRREGLILRPDITFIVDGRESIVSDRVWGPPDMVLEVTSPLTHSGPLEERVAWFSLYGVRDTGSCIRSMRKWPFSSWRTAACAGGPSSMTSHR